MSLAENQGRCRALSKHRAKTAQSAREVLDALHGWKGGAAGWKDDQVGLLSSIPEEISGARVGGEKP